MLRVAICDDDQETCALLREMLCGFSDIPTLRIDVFYSGESLCNAVQGGKCYDLFILDIELKTTTGVQVGSFLRKDLLQGQAQILFISGKDSYMKQLFDLRPLNFLLKPIEPSKMHECMLCALRLFEQSAPYFQYFQRQSLNRIPYRDILYFESRNKNLMIHTLGETYETAMQLSEVLRASPPLPEHFMQIHQSYLINFQYVKRATYSDVLMENGDLLSISYTYHKEVRERIHALSIALREV